MSEYTEETAEFIRDLGQEGTFDLEDESSVYQEIIRLLMDEMSEKQLAVFNQELMNWFHSESGYTYIQPQHYKTYQNRLHQLINSQ